VLPPPLIKTNCFNYTTSIAKMVRDLGKIIDPEGGFFNRDFSIKKFLNG